MPEWGYQVRQRLPCQSGAIKCNRNCHARVGLLSATEILMPEWAIKCDRDCHARVGLLSATEILMPEWAIKCDRDCHA